MNNSSASLEGPQQVTRLPEGRGRPPDRDRDPEGPGAVRDVRVAVAPQHVAAEPIEL